MEEEGGQHDDGPEGDRTGLAVGLGVIGAGDLEEYNIFVKWKCVSFFSFLTSMTLITPSIFKSVSPPGIRDNAGKWRFNQNGEAGLFFLFTPGESTVRVKMWTRCGRMGLCVYVCDPNTHPFLINPPSRLFSSTCGLPASFYSPSIPLFSVSFSRFAKFH